MNERYIKTFGNITIYYFNGIGALNKMIIDLLNLDLLHSVCVKIEVPDFFNFNHYYYNTSLEKIKIQEYRDLFLQYEYILVVNYTKKEMKKLEKKLIKKKCV